MSSWSGRTACCLCSGLAVLMRGSLAAVCVRLQLSIWLGTKVPRPDVSARRFMLSLLRKHQQRWTVNITDTSPLQYLTNIVFSPRFDSIVVRRMNALTLLASSIDHTSAENSPPIIQHRPMRAPSSSTSTDLSFMNQGIDQVIEGHDPEVASGREYFQFNHLHQI